MSSLRSAGLVLFLAACHSTVDSKPPAPDVGRAEAGSIVDASAARDLGPPSLRVVAVTSDGVRLRAWDKDRVVVDGGVFVYGTTDRSGALGLLGSPRDYALESGGDDLVGLGSRAPRHGRHLSTSPERLLLAGRSGVRAWDGRQWSTADVDAGAINGEPQEERELLDRLPFGGPADFVARGCRPVLSGEKSNTYYTCANATLVQIPENADTRVVTVHGLEALRSDTPIAIASDGAIWFAPEHRLRRVTADGSVTELPLPRPNAELLRPRFSGGYEEQMSAVYVREKGQARYWQTTSLKPAPSTLVPNYITKIVPLADGSVWILAYAEARDRPGAAVYRYGPGEPAPILIGTPFDQQIAIRNAGAIRPWSASCPQSFVAAPKADRSLESMLPVVKATLGEAGKRKIASHVVEGRLGDRAVRGVLLHLTSPEADQKALARATGKLVEQLEGEAFCSVPLVTRTLEAQ